MPLRRVAFVVALTVTSLIVAATAVLAVVVALQWDRVLPNTTVAGVDVSGVDEVVARQRLQELADRHAQTALTLTFESETLTFRPTDANWSLDIDDSLKVLFSRGRQGALAPVARLAAYVQPQDLEPVHRWDEQRIDHWVTTVARQIERRAFAGELLIDPDRVAVTTRPPHGGASVDKAQLREILSTAVEDLNAPDQIRPLPVDLTPSPVDPDQFNEVAEAVTAALEAPIHLSTGDGTFTVTRHQLARLIAIQWTTDGDRQRVSFAVTPRKVHQVIDFPTQRAFDTEPVNAAFDLEREPPVTFDTRSSTSFAPVEIELSVIPGQAGTRFSAEIFAGQLTELLHAGIRRAPLELALIDPDVTTDDARELAPSHLLGTFTTYHEAGQTRVHNIQLLADTIDGAIVRPGEQFSINRISGQRSCEKGYRPAGTIIRGELVDTCGGGVSQFGTTTFNAAFFAGVQLDQWRAHSFYISRYPMGREATLNYPELDVRFTNNTPALIVVRTSYTPSSITVSLFGQPIATEVRAEHGSTTNPRPPSTQVRWTDDLYEGQERVIQQAGANGFNIRVVRTVDRLDGSTTTEVINTAYLPQHRIVERGTRPRPD